MTSVLYMAQRRTGASGRQNQDPNTPITPGREKATPNQRRPKVERSIQEVLNYQSNPSGRGRQMVLAALQKQRQWARSADGLGCPTEATPVESIVDEVDKLPYRSNPSGRGRQMVLAALQKQSEWVRSAGCPIEAAPVSKVGRLSYRSNPSGRGRQAALQKRPQWLGARPKNLVQFCIKPPEKETLPCNWHTRRGRQMVLATLQKQKAASESLPVVKTPQSVKYSVKRNGEGARSAVIPVELKGNKILISDV